MGLSTEDYNMIEEAKQLKHKILRNIDLEKNGRNDEETPVTVRYENFLKLKRKLLNT